MTQPKLASRNEEGRERTYALPVGTFPSVTSIIGRLAKPALVPWAAKMAAYEAVDKYRPNLNPTSREAVAKKLAGASRRYTADSSAAGSRIHAAIDQYLDAPEAYAGGCRFVDMFLEAIQGWTVIAHEKTCFNATDEWAGSADLFLQHDLSGRVACVDLKSGKSVYPETAMQLAAYARHEGFITDEGEIEPGIEVDEAYVLHLPAKQHLTPPGYRWHQVSIDQDVYDCFLALKHAVVGKSWVGRATKTI